MRDSSELAPVISMAGVAVESTADLVVTTAEVSESDPSFIQQKPWRPPVK
jgi:hypothetical protein